MSPVYGKHRSGMTSLCETMLCNTIYSCFLAILCSNLASLFLTGNLIILFYCHQRPIRLGVLTEWVCLGMKLEFSTIYC